VNKQSDEFISSVHLLCRANNYKLASLPCVANTKNPMLMLPWLYELGGDETYW